MDSKRNEEMETEREMQEDVVIVGTGAAGLFAALNLPRDRKILIITKNRSNGYTTMLNKIIVCC